MNIIASIYCANANCTGKQKWHFEYSKHRHTYTYIISCLLCAFDVLTVWLMSWQNKRTEWLTQTNRVGNCAIEREKSEMKRSSQDLKKIIFNFIFSLLCISNRVRERNIRTFKCVSYSSAYKMWIECMFCTHVHTIMAFRSVCVCASVWKMQQSNGYAFWSVWTVMLCTPKRCLCNDSEMRCHAVGYRKKYTIFWQLDH